MSSSTPRADARISVIVPAYNATRLLPVCLAALNRQTCLPGEIIVVDDGSTDDTAEQARCCGARVLCQPNQGPAAARNAGARAARGDLLLFTDADCEPDPHWIEQLAAPFRDPALAGARGTYRTRQRSRVARFVQQEYEHKYEHMARCMARQGTVDFVDTYSAAYRRDVFLNNGGFDSAFKVPSVEDQEFSFRLARKGYNLAFVPGAAVWHQHDETLGEYVARKFGIGYWKAALLRWLPEKTWADSHTPASQRVQMACLGLLGLGIAGGALGLLTALAWLATPAWLAALAGLLVFFISALPFLARVWSRDRAVAAVAPLLLLCRAAALSAGLLAGMVVPPIRRSRASGGLSWLQRPAKRLLDVAGAVAGLVVALPILAVAALAIKLDGPGPLFFTQERAGEGGRPFRILKLRTMVHDPALAGEPAAGRIPKPRDDPRVTRVGRVLRRWSIDELPQFWNVLRGEMSLVGPRPDTCEAVSRYDDRQRQCLLVKPGMTGPMQVAGRGDLDLDARIEVELRYIEHYNLLADLRILAQTIPAVLSGRGAY
jgi:lipopolysaccharide/colanic/teichoic acid biosynthesis glycosyltransferase/GT2 family glycosyltransferase